MNEIHHNHEIIFTILYRIKSDELAKIWTPSEPENRRESPFSIRTFGNSVSTQIIRRSDGSIEERRTARDSEGNEEIRVTRQIGDKKHTIITQKAKDGSETKTEDIVNMDESEFIWIFIVASVTQYSKSKKTTMHFCLFR